MNRGALAKNDLSIYVSRLKRIRRSLLGILIRNSIFLFFFFYGATNRKSLTSIRHHLIRIAVVRKENLSWMVLVYNINLNSKHRLLYAHLNLLARRKYLLKYLLLTRVFTYICMYVRTYFSFYIEGRVGNRLM